MTLDDRIAELQYLVPIKVRERLPLYEALQDAMTGTKLSPQNREAIASLMAKLDDIAKEMEA